MLEHGPKGRSVLNVNENMHEWEDDANVNLLEVICDADYAGQKDARKLVSSVQIYLNGQLLSCQREKGTRLCNHPFCTAVRSETQLEDSGLSH